MLTKIVNGEVVEMSAEEAAAVLALWEANTPSLNAIKDKKYADINDAASKVAAQLTAGYPEFEMKTWPQQESESMAWGADNTALTPMIDTMAQERGIDRALYLQKTLSKVTTFREKSAKLVGQRQKFADKVAAATTIEEIAAIVPTFDLA